MLYCIVTEPTEDWTVEQTLQWWLLRAHDETDAKHDEIVKSLTKQMEQGKKEIWDCHKQVVDTFKTGGGIHVRPTPQEVTMENVDPQQQNKKATRSAKSKAQQATAPAPAGTAPTGAIHVEVIGGEYEGNTYVLQPKNKTPCWVGRSQGKKFRDRGISLPKDLEVSTTHGKFELIRATKLCYTDTNSTNGSKLRDGTELEPEKPFELSDGVEIVVGQTVMRITLP